MTDTAAIDLAALRTRLALLLLAAPALVWLLGLIVLPHVDLAALSLRARVAPRTYEFSFDNYRTFIDEPLYWHTFVRTVSLTQNGIRQRTSRTDLACPRAILTMYHAVGKPIASVHAVAMIDMAAVRTKVCQYSGSSMNVR